MALSSQAGSFAVAARSGCVAVLCGARGGGEDPPAAVPSRSSQTVVADGPLLAGGPSDVVGRVPRLCVLHPVRHRAHCREFPPCP